MIFLSLLLALQLVSDSARLLQPQPLSPGRPGTAGVPLEGEAEFLENYKKALLARGEEGMMRLRKFFPPGASQRGMALLSINQGLSLKFPVISVTIEKPSDEELSV